MEKCEFILFFFLGLRDCFAKASHSLFEFVVLPLVQVLLLFSCIYYMKNDNMEDIKLSL